MVPGCEQCEVRPFLSLRHRTIVNNKMNLITHILLNLAFFLMILQISLNIPGGIGMFFSTHSVCGTTGILTGEKNSNQKLPHSFTSQANPSFCRHMKTFISFISSSHRKLTCFFSSFVCHCLCTCL